MKGKFNFRLIVLLSIIMGIYFFLTNVDLPVQNKTSSDYSIAYVDSVRQLDLFDFYSFDQVYYHYRVNDLIISDSVTESRHTGTVNKGDSLLVIISKFNPEQHTVKSIYGRSQEPTQLMSR